VAGLFWEKSTAGWWLISRANMSLLLSCMWVFTCKTISNLLCLHDLRVQVLRNDRWAHGTWQVHVLWSGTGNLFN
jgi:hypothetical protein